MRKSIFAAFSSSRLTAGLTAMALGLTLYAGAAHANAALDQQAMATLQNCKTISLSCAATTNNAAGILVFPAVIKADLIIGGAGGKGALIENGKITGYYNIGAGTAGLEAGIDKSSEVYIFRSPQALARLKSGSEWRVGADAGVTVVKADANAGSTTGDIATYIFDSKGLHGDAAVRVFDVWKTGQPRPQQ